MWLLKMTTLPSQDAENAGAAGNADESVLPSKMVLLTMLKMVKMFKMLLLEMQRGLLQLLLRISLLLLVPTGVATVTKCWY